MAGTLPLPLPRLALITGAMKCGTSTVFHHLASHPEVSPARPKEPQFFADDQVWARGLDWYRSLFDWQPGHRVALDGCTSVTKRLEYPHAPRRIATLDADVRLVYMVRDPFERIESQVRHAMSREWGAGAGARRVPQRIVDLSDYHGQLEFLCADLPDAPLLVLSLDALRDDPAKTLSRVEDFLGLSHREHTEIRLRNESSRRRRIRPLWQQAAHWFGLERTRGMTRMLRRRGLGRLVDTHRVPMYTLSSSERARIHDVLAPGMRHLHDEHGVDVSSWGF